MGKLFVLFVLFTVAAAGCDEFEFDRRIIAESFESETYYIKDYRTNLCFIASCSPSRTCFALATVPCADRVETMLINRQEKPCAKCAGEKTAEAPNPAAEAIRIPYALRRCKAAWNNAEEPISNVERLQILKDYGFYYYDAQRKFCFRAVLFYQAVSETQVECTKEVQAALINKNEYPKN